MVSLRVIKIALIASPIDPVGVPVPSIAIIVLIVSIFGWV
jgi:hypothetical protein